MAEPLITRLEFGDLLSGLEAPALAGLVADLWELRGWETRRDGRFVLATRETPIQERQRLLAYTGSTEDGDLQRPDVVVTVNRDAPSAAALADRLGADLVDGDDLHRLVLYAIDRDDADDLLHRWFGRGIFQPGQNSGVPREEARRRPVPTRARSTRVGRDTAVLLVLVVVGAAVVAGALGPSTVTAPGTPTVSPVSDAALERLPTPVQTPTEHRATTRPDTVEASILPQREYVSLEPTCKRPPGLVVSIVIGALRHNEPSTHDGIETAWRFSGPGGLGPTYGVFAAHLRDPRYSPLFSFRKVEYGPVGEVGDGVADQRVTITDRDSRRLTYRFVLVEHDDGPHAGCWRITDIVPPAAWPPEHPSSL